MGRAVVLSGIACLLAVASPPATGGSLVGTVRNAVTSAAIPDAVVTVHVVDPESVALPDTSDSGGAYGIFSIPPGNRLYAIVADKPGFARYYFRMDDLGTADRQLEILLTAEVPPPPGGGGDSGTVSGFVVARSPSGSAMVPIAGAAVTLTGPGGPYKATSDANGKYSFRLPQASYGLSVQAQGYASLADGRISLEAKGLTLGSLLRLSTTDVHSGAENRLPEQFALRDAYPNPFNPSTMLAFELPKESRVSLRIYDLLGREITSLVDAILPAGYHTARFEAGQNPGSIYFARMEAMPTGGGRTFVSTRRLVLLK